NCTTSPQSCDFLAGRYEAVIQRNGRTAEASYWQSRAFARLAQNAFEHLERLPESPEIHELRAEQLRARRQNLESAKEWRKALTYAPMMSTCAKNCYRRFTVLEIIQRP